jgi:hypothetical protein
VRRHAFCLFVDGDRLQNLLWPRGAHGLIVSQL